MPAEGRGVGRTCEWAHVCECGRMCEWARARVNEAKSRAVRRGGWEGG